MDDGWTVVGAPKRRHVAGSHPKEVQIKQTEECSTDGAAGSGLPGWSSNDVVLPKKKVSKRKHGIRSAAEQLEHCRDLILDCIQDVRRSRVYEEVHAKMKEGTQLLCSTSMDFILEFVIYGLGSIEDHRVSRFQMAMAVLLHEHLQHLPGPPLMFDPAFSETDVALLKSFGMDVIQDNEEGKRTVQQPTFFYLAHCEGWLCDNLVAANWSVSRLSSVVILGNSFGTYQQRWSSSTNRPSTGSRPDNMLRLVEAGAVVELPIRDFSYHVTSAFNDLSLHFFPADKLAEAGLPP